MTRPRRYIVRMVLFLVAVVGACLVLFAPLRDAFLANAPLNGLILVALLLGIIHNFRQVLRLRPEVDWLEQFRAARSRAAPTAAEPVLLAPMARMIGDRTGRLSLSAMAMRSLLDGIASRLDESRDLSRYGIGLLIFLGLLGTFWGLLNTVGAVAEVIGGLSIRSADVAAMFTELKAGLGAPLEGMGTAFSSSLFGLGGSLVLGFLDLQAGQAQNRFYTDLEDWLSGVTRLGSGGLASEGEAPMPAYVQALLEQTAESLDGVQRALARGEDSRASAAHQLNALSENIATLIDQMRTEQLLMTRLAEGQSELKPILARLADGPAATPPVIDDATRTHIRNIELYAARAVEEMVSGREETISQVRAEIRLLARTIAALAEDESGS